MSSIYQDEVPYSPEGTKEFQQIIEIYMIENTINLTDHI